jgi:hypothetical protein
MALPQTVENIRGILYHYRAYSTSVGAFQPVAGNDARLPRSFGTDFAIADLCTWNPLQHMCNSLKNKRQQS